MTATATKVLHTESITVGQPLAGIYFKPGIGTVFDYSGIIREVAPSFHGLRLVLEFSNGHRATFYTDLDGGSDSTGWVRTCPTCHKHCTPFGLRVQHKHEG
jgi:hypothetical protein